jgi:uncharacterized protein (DUF4415 family)
MDEAEKLEIIRTKISPNIDEITKEITLKFDDVVLEQMQIIERGHQCLPMNELLRPFTI